MFVINGVVWYVCFVNPFEDILYDYHNDCFTVATTDAYYHTIFIAYDVSDEFLYKILKHELYHCYEFSGIAFDLPLFYEEIVADFIATYGQELIELAYDLYEQITYYK